MTKNLSSYLDLYFKFQQEFKPVQFFSEQKDIINSAMNILSNILNDAVGEDFVKAIKLVYPNYFTGTDDEYVPIADNLILFNDETDPNSSDLGKRVLQHMSYYLVPDSGLESPQIKSFIRISKSLIMNRKSKVSSFYVEKDDEDYKARVYLNGSWDINYYTIPKTCYAVNLINNNNQIGSFKKSNTGKNIFEYEVGDSAIKTVEEETVNEDFNNASDFCKLFADPISAHFVMLNSTSLLYIYSKTAQIGKEGNLGYGGLFVLLSNNKKYTDKEIEDYRSFFQLISDYISICIAHNIMREMQLRESEKSAKSAIMSRNMSHNLGSHVMSYLKQQLNSVTSIMKDENKVLENLIPDSVKSDLKNYLQDAIHQSKRSTSFVNTILKRCLRSQYFITDISRVLNIVDSWEPTKIENVELPFLVGLGRFINYLQERQDYIATISTDYIPYGAPVNLKDAIYDELNPDLRYLRHKKESNNDAKNMPANILLNYIAKSEGLSRENMKDEFISEKDIRIGFVDISKTGVQTFGIANSNNTQAAFESKNVALTKMRKMNFSLPGGLVGRQALFSIIENLIRNAAKHGDTTAVENLDFTLDVIDGSDIARDVDFKAKKVKNGEPKVIGWESRVCDDKWRSLYEKASDLDDIYLLTITDNLPCNKDVVENLKRGLYELFVDPSNNQMTTANKGIKEIRISAAWIRGITDEERYLKYNDSDNTTNKLAPLVAVELSADNHLRYIICIRKNKTVAIVSKVNVGKDDNGNDVFVEFDKKALKLFEKLREGNKDRWTILTDEELKNSKTSYSFILSPDNDKVFSILRPFTSNRLCRWKINKDSEDALNRLDEKDMTLMYIYQLFTELGNDSENIYIADGRAETANNDRESTGEKVHFPKIKFVNKDTRAVQYLYRTHHATEKDYKGFYKQHINVGERYDCIEGITGDNSSDRLVRREPLDEKWYYTHLYAMKKKVAIIDERIFKMVHRIDENLFVVKSDEMIPTINLRGIATEVNFENLRERIAFWITDNDLFEPILDAKTIDELANIVPEIPRTFVDDKAQIDRPIWGDSHQTPYYLGKQVDIYTVVKDAKGNMILVGCVKIDFNANDNTFNNKFEKVGTFIKKDGTFKLEPVNDEYAKLFTGRYDYISIHQGILDKIYENFDIKKDDEAKCQLTAGIHQCMMVDKTTIGKYLPRFIIHSGRAKPTKEDMPQKQPFVQYAAIENAVKDCKPMLIDLLDFAKYEATNN